LQLLALICLFAVFPAATGPAQKLKRPEPGDPGIDPRVLDYDTFNKLPAMQHGNPQRRLSRDVNAPTEPKCDWQEYQAPYPQVGAV
jgi:hypothetical protein